MSATLLPFVDPAVPASAFDPFCWFHLVGNTGCALWIIAYALFIRRAYLDKATTIPFLAVALNFSWELMYAFVLPNPVPLWRFFGRAWLGLDFVIVWQLLRYARREPRFGVLSKHLPLVFAGTVLLGFIVQLTFVITYSDRLGLMAAFLINLVMSVLFVLLFFERPQQRGLSYAGAWLKLFGTMGTWIMCHPFMAIIDPELPSQAFLHFIGAAILLFDALYVGLLWNARRKAR